MTTTVRDFVKMAFAEVGIELAFEGEGVQEVGKIAKCQHPDYQLLVGKEVIAIDPNYFRPTEVELLLGDPSKAQEKLGWEREYDLKGLVQDMMAADLKLFERDSYLLQGGHKVLQYKE